MERRYFKQKTRWKGGILQKTRWRIHRLDVIFLVFLELVRPGNKVYFYLMQMYGVKSRDEVERKSPYKMRRGGIYIFDETRWMKKMLL